MALCYCGAPTDCAISDRRDQFDERKLTPDIFLSFGKVPERGVGEYCQSTVV